jgi:hypothetical protein
VNSQTKAREINGTDLDASEAKYLKSSGLYWVLEIMIQLTLYHVYIEKDPNEVIPDKYVFEFLYSIPKRLFGSSDKQNTDDLVNIKKSMHALMTNPGIVLANIIVHLHNRVPKGVAGLFNIKYKLKPEDDINWQYILGDLSNRIAAGSGAHVLFDLHLLQYVQLTRIRWGEEESVENLADFIYGKKLILQSCNHCNKLVWSA